MIARVGVFFIILGGLYFYFNKPSDNQIEAELVKPDIEDLEKTGTDSIFFLPTSTTGQVVMHKYYALSYIEDLELPEWVVFELTSGRLNQAKVESVIDYRPDPKIESGSASPNDYSDSNFRMGQMASAADMAFDPVAMSESFFMSNMAPLTPGFNKYIWRDLEEMTYNWAKRFGHLYIVTGPIINDNVELRIGENEVAIPSAFYKIILDIRGPQKKAIAFVVPNKMTTMRIEDFAVTIDSVEYLTGIDFFPDLMPGQMEDSLESSIDIFEWNSITQ